MTETHNGHTTILSGPRPDPSKPTGIEAAFADMLARMQRVPPRNFNTFVQPDDGDLQDRADTLRIHIKAFQIYVAAFMKDCANASWNVETKRLYLDGLFDDLVSDACGCLQKAADKTREGVTYCAS